MTGAPPRLPPPLPNTAMSGGLPEGLGGLGCGSGEFDSFDLDPVLSGLFWRSKGFGRMNSSYRSCGCAKTVTGWWQLKCFCYFHPDV